MKTDTPPTAKPCPPQREPERAAIAAGRKKSIIRSDNMTTTNERDLYYSQRLAEMIRCKTVSHKEGFEPEEFLKLRRVIGTLFPLVTEKAERTILGEDAYLYKFPGKDPSRNILLMSHHDVVEATGSWQEAPFAGVIRGGKLWGRGTVDTKTPLFAEFSALEELLLEGFEFPVNVYLFSSHNEEYSGDGALLAHDYFIGHSIRFDWISDEGGAVIAPPMPGIGKKCAMIAVHEKGRCTAQLVAEPQQGHAGLAGAHKTPVMRMAAFMTEVDEKKPFIRRLHPEVRGMFEALAPHMAFPMRTVFSNLGLHVQEHLDRRRRHLPGAGISALHQRRGLRKRSRHPAQDGRVPRRADRPARRGQRILQAHVP